MDDPTLRSSESRPHVPCNTIWWVAPYLHQWPDVEQFQRPSIMLLRSEACLLLIAKKGAEAFARNPQVWFIAQAHIDESQQVKAVTNRPRHTNMSQESERSAVSVADGVKVPRPAMGNEASEGGKFRWHGRNSRVLSAAKGSRRFFTIRKKVSTPPYANHSSSCHRVLLWRWPHTDGRQLL